MTTTIPLTPQMFEMLKRAGDGGSTGSLERKIMTAEALRNRGLATVGSCASGEVVVRVTAEGRWRLTHEHAQEMPGAPLITWSEPEYGPHYGLVRGVELFELEGMGVGTARWYRLRSMVLSEVIDLPLEGFAAPEAAKIAAEHLFRAFGRRLGLVPTPLETWCPRCYLDAEDGSAYIISDDGLRRCEKCDAVLVVPDPPLTGGA